MDVRTNALAVGTELEGYRIVSVLGTGGFGITYKAVDILLGRSVAIKELLPSLLAGRSQDGRSIQPHGQAEANDLAWGLERFRAEAKILVAFQHPNIVPVHRYFEANGTGYLVMAFQDGKSLADIIEHVGTLNEEELTVILRPLADGLAEVHAKGFLHRDIKPANIFVRRDGSPVLLDFGAARQALSLQSKSLTAIVTQGYAPYEQYEAEGNQGPWTDLYAFGAVLYHCITGKRPADALQRVAARIRNQPDPVAGPVQAAEGQYSPTLLSAISSALGVLEGERPQTVGEFLAILDGTAQPRPVSVRISSPSELPSHAFLGNAVVEPPSLAGSTPLAPAGGDPATLAASPSGARGDYLPISRLEAESSARRDFEPGRIVGGETLLVGANAPSGPSVPQPPRAAQTRSGRPVGIVAGAVVSVLALGAVGAVVLVRLAQDERAVSERAEASPKPAVESPKAVEQPPAPAPATPDAALAATRSKSAPPERLWSLLEPKPNHEIPRRLFVSGTSEFLVIGDRHDPATGRSDAWLLRLDSNEGRPQGERRTIPDVRLDNGNAVALLANGTLAMAGGRRSPAGDGQSAWIARLSRDGEVLWERLFGARRNTTAYAIAAASDGALIVAGTTNARGPDGYRGWLMRLNAAGSVAWDKTFGGGRDDGSSDSFQSVAVLPDGGIIAAGWISSRGAGGADVWVLRLDSDGNPLWGEAGKYFGSGAEDRAKAVLTLPDGDFLVLAETLREPPRPRGRGRLPLDGEPISKPWLIRLTPEGDVRRDRPLSAGGDERSDSLEAAVALADGGFVFAGNTEAKGGGKKDGWLLRTDESFNPLWDTVFGEQFDDEFNALAALPDGGFVVAGSTAIKLESDPLPRAGRARPERVDAEARLWVTRLGYK